MSSTVKSVILASSVAVVMGRFLSFGAAILAHDAAAWIPARVTERCSRAIRCEVSTALALPLPARGEKERGLSAHLTCDSPAPQGEREREGRAFAHLALAYG